VQIAARPFTLYFEVAPVQEHIQNIKLNIPIFWSLAPFHKNDRIWKRLKNLSIKVYFYSLPFILLPILLFHYFY